MHVTVAQNFHIALSWSVILALAMLLLMCAELFLLRTGTGKP